MESLQLIAVCALAVAVSDRAAAQLYINEIFFNPGMSAVDDKDEYIEIRGTPDASLANYYLIFVEGDDDLVGEGPAGLIDNVYDLNYNAANPRNSASRSAPTAFWHCGKRTTATRIGIHVNSNANNWVNAGSGKIPGGVRAPAVRSAPPTSSTKDNSKTPRFTAMIIRKDGDLVPTVGLDMDVNNDGLDVVRDPTHWSNNWTIVDAIGLSASQEIEDSEFARLYAKVNFFADFAACPASAHLGAKD